MKGLTNREELNNFESIKHSELGIEFWYARELMPLLEYTKWDNFNKIIYKAIETLRVTYPQISDHFAEVSKKIKVGLGTKKEATREIIDYKLSRYICYLIAQNGDSRKRAIALAQTYFATQTRKQELYNERQKDIERIIARKKLSETEKKFGGVLDERGITGLEIGVIKSAGDEALFGKSTKILKKNLGIKTNKPLADFLPTISIKAKDLAMEMTTFNTQKKDLQGTNVVQYEHIGNNSSVRRMLNENGIYPERLPLEEDIKKLEKKFSPDEIDAISENSLLTLERLEIDIRNIVDENELINIKNLIQNNLGNSTLIIYYGSKEDPKILEREIQINPDVLNGLKKYLVLN